MRFLVIFILLCVGRSDMSEAAKPPELEVALAQWEGLRAADDPASAMLGPIVELAGADAENLDPIVASRVAAAAWGVANKTLALKYDAIATRRALDSPRAVVVRVTSQRLDHLLLDARFAEALAASGNARANYHRSGALPEDVAKLDWFAAEAARELGDVDMAAQRLTEGERTLGRAKAQDWPLFVRLAISRADLFSVKLQYDRAADMLLRAIASVSSKAPAGLQPSLKGRLFARLGGAYAGLGEPGRAQDSFATARRFFTGSAVMNMLTVDDAIAMVSVESWAVVFSTTDLMILSGLNRSDGMSFATRLGPWLKILIREGGGSVISYRTRIFAGAMLDFLSASIMINDDATAKQMLAGFITAAATDPDPQIQLRAIRARSSLDLRTTGGTTQLRDTVAARQRAATGRDPVGIATLADLGALQLMMDSPVTASASLKTAVEQQAAREAAMGRAVASTGGYNFGGLSWVAHLARGGRGNPLDIVYPLYLEALSQMQVTRPATAETDNEAFRVLQYATQSDLSATMASITARVAARQPRLAGMLRRRDDMELAIDGDEQVLARKFANDAPDSRSFAADIVRRRTILAELEARIASDFPDFRRLGSEPVASLADVQKVLRDDEAMVIVVGGKDLPPTIKDDVDGPRALTGVYVAAISRNSFLWKRAPISSIKLAQIARELRCELDNQSCGGTVPTPGLFDTRASNILYEALLGPLKTVLLGKKSLLIVANGSLSTLPFSVLTTKATPIGWRDDDARLLARAPWLIRDYALTLVPTVASFHMLRTRPIASEDDRSPFIGFGDPLFLEGGTAAKLKLSPLPWSGFELRQIRDITQAPGKAILTGQSATEAAIRTADLRHYRTVMFATHGLTAGAWPATDEPGLVLSESGRLDARDDGFLAASEVSGLKLDADLVILSACRTAAPDGRPEGDSLSGLARSFFHAGARSILVSYWDVKDDIAALATIGTVRRQTEQHMSRAQALRASLLDLIDDPDEPEHAHPSLWAPLVLIGDDHGANKAN